MMGFINRYYLNNRLQNSKAGENTQTLTVLQSVRIMIQKPYYPYFLPMVSNCHYFLWHGFAIEAGN